MGEPRGRECRYYPCHFEGQDCRFCFCPFYPCGDTRTGGRWIISSRGRRVWSCKNCHWIHRPGVAERLEEELRKGRRSREEMQELRRRLMKSASGILMVLGTSSSAGKSFIAMALCRIFSDMGYRVAPFKAQNTSLNSYVTPDGGEIARAQALQAFAARVEPEVDMNPLLLKPCGERRSQLVVLGKPRGVIDAAEYYRSFTLSEGLRVVREAVERLKEGYEVVVMEGAGSPAEINLMHADIANLRAAEVADAPAVLVADIERGGAFASIYGTVMLLPEEWRARVRGIIINKFRGDSGLLGDAIEGIERLTSVPVLGVVPYVEDAELPEEDSMGLRCSREGEVCVIRLPRISNFTDFDALRGEVGVRFVTSPEELNGCGAVIIPGTKNTLHDLEWLRERGFEEALRRLHGRVWIFGICGGFQMLGERVVDEVGVEDGEPRECRGLGMLRMETWFEREKTLRRVEVDAREGLTGRRVRVRGYEVHMGRSVHRHEPLLEAGEWREGACDLRGRVAGTYLHGIFDAPGFRQVFLECVLGRRASVVDAEERLEEAVSRVAEVVRESIDMRRLLEIVFGGGG